MGVHEEQAAFYAGVLWAHDQCPVHGYPELVKGEAARRYPIPAVEQLAAAADLSTEEALEAVASVVEAFAVDPFAYQLTHAEREGEYRDKLLEAAAGYPQFSDLLWGVSPAPIWTTDGMVSDFKALAFEAPYVRAQNRVTGQEGTLQFTARPRFYYGWVPS